MKAIVGLGATRWWPLRLLIGRLKNLDAESGATVLKLLRSLPEPGKRCVVMVTHDPEAARYGDRIVHIRDGLIAGDEMVPKGPGQDGRYEEPEADLRTAIMPAPDS